jgi:hypothetical protein
MDGLAPPVARHAQAIRWTARITGILFIGIFLAFFVPDLAQKGTTAVASDRIPATIFLFLSFVGIALAWRWEGAGGLAALGSITVSAVLFLQTEVKPAATILLWGMYALPAVLFLLSWWRARLHRHSESATPGGV